jgi:arabinofuranosyltransferase
MSTDDPTRDTELAPNRDQQPATTFDEWRNGAPLSPRAAFVAGAVLPSILLVVNMYRVRSFTVDDAYISYRYARNFARGLGLVYNPGERVEGYTNFLWTLLLGVGMKIGFDPDALAKVLGGLCGVGAILATYAVAARLRRFRTFPCVATWLLATTPVLSGYAVYGLETSLFVFLVVAGLLLFLRETGGVMRGKKGRERASEPVAFPWSGLVFALAGLTRPEAPAYLGILMLFLGWRMFGRQNLIRGAMFGGIVGAHLVFRKAYYGAWLPHTLGAKTGNLTNQLRGGWGYVQAYLANQGPAVWIALLGVAIGIVLLRRDVLAIATTAVFVVVYVVFVGGDWMPHHRFMAPFEPFCFLLVDLGARWMIDRRERATTLALAIFLLAMIPFRTVVLRDAQRQFNFKERTFWTKAAGGTADWFLENGDPGTIAVGDIGYLGYKTDYPILDLLGLVDPVIGKLPGGYTQKLGPRFLDRFFEVAPKYMLIVSASMDCQKPSVPNSQVVYRDRRFHQQYGLVGKVPLDGGFAWCVYRNRESPANEGASPPPARPARPVE